MNNTLLVSLGIWGFLGTEGRSIKTSCDFRTDGRRRIKERIERCVIGNERLKTRVNYTSPLLRTRETSQRTHLNFVTVGNFDIDFVEKFCTQDYKNEDLETFRDILVRQFTTYFPFYL